MKGVAPMTEIELLKLIQGGGKHPGGIVSDPPLR